MGSTVCALTYCLVPYIEPHNLRRSADATSSVDEDAPHGGIAKLFKRSRNTLAAIRERADAVIASEPEQSEIAEAPRYLRSHEISIVARQARPRSADATIGGRCCTGAVRGIQRHDTHADGQRRDCCGRLRSCGRFLQGTRFGAGGRGASRGTLGGLIGLDGVLSDIAMMQTPAGHGRVELTKFRRPKAAADCLSRQSCVALRDSPRETLANLSITGHLRCFSDQPVAEIVQCGEPIPSTS